MTKSRDLKQIGSGQQYVSSETADGRWIYEIINPEEKRAIQRRGRILTVIAVAIWIVVMML